jgi:hypothetical protein
LRKAATFAATVIVVTAVWTTAASAQGLFDFLFGGIRRALSPPASEGIPIDPRRQYGPPGRESVNQSDTSGAPRVAFCVRLCDGRYFPISNGRTAAATCNSLCPGSSTRLFYGRNIDSAHDRSGRGYRQLEHAFVYRTKIVPGCSCDGRASAGVAQVPLNNDPTLKSGDIVAGASGLTVYRGTDAQHGLMFAPVEAATLSRRLQDELAGMEVAPQPGSTNVEDPPSANVEETEARPEPTPQQRVNSSHDVLWFRSQAQ